MAINIPSVFYPSPNEWPNTALPLTGITKAVNAKITCPNHGLTTANDVGLTVVNCTLVQGMFQVNGLPGLVLQVIDANNIVAQINTLTFTPYTSGGFMNIIAGHAPYDPLQNLFP